MPLHRSHRLRIRPPWRDESIAFYLLHRWIHSTGGPKPGQVWAPAWTTSVHSTPLASPLREPVIAHATQAVLDKSFLRSIVSKSWIARSGRDRVVPRHSALSYIALTLHIGPRPNRIRIFFYTSRLSQGSPLPPSFIFLAGHCSLWPFCRA